MGNTESLQLFEDRRIRTAWNEEEEKWYFSIVDIIGVLTDQPDLEHARNYWKVLKNRLKAEDNETVTNCNRLKLTAAEWCCVNELSRISIECGSMPVRVPDFTRGDWNRVKGFSHLR